MKQTVNESRGSETEKVWLEFRTRLLGFIRSRVDDEADAEDILQDVFVRIHAHSEKLGDVSHLSGWLFQITRNAITDHYRSAASASRTLENAVRETRTTETETAADWAGFREPHDEPTDGNGLAGCMRFLMSRLPRNYEEAVELVELDGLTQREAAEKTGISLSGMKSRVQRGRSQLRGALLSCCKVELDGRQRVIDYEPTDCDCEGCG